jgi:hypothetical protein
MNHIRRLEGRVVGVTRNVPQMAVAAFFDAIALQL